MRILLLHPEDTLEPFRSERWDLVIDLARAPASSYESWSRKAGCKVISLFQFSQETDDLRYLKRLIDLGLDRVIDRFSIDWWDVTSLMVAEELLKIELARRACETLERGAQVFTTRTNGLSLAFGILLGADVTDLSGHWATSTRRKIAHYAGMLSRFDAHELIQIGFDKYDQNHGLRRRLAPRARRSGKPVVLAPTAYVNVSRTVVNWAQVLPDQQFLLVHARKSGALKKLLPNVRSTALDSYFGPVDEGETKSVIDRWHGMLKSLTKDSEDYATASAAGVLNRVPGLIRWGMAVRDAWNRVLDSEEVTGCLCADDSNPYTRIPVMLTHLRGIPSVACHHGALDARMAFKRPHWDWYLAKGEMEFDYLTRTCKVRPENLMVGGLGSARPAVEPVRSGNTDRSWMVFFTEPYQSQTAPWRNIEIHRELLPRLAALARARGLRFILKLHPSENQKVFRQLTRALLPPEDLTNTQIIAEPMAESQWAKIGFAVTVESTVSMECAMRGIPVFLLGWLRDSLHGYVQQYARFGSGIVLNSPDEITKIPDLLKEYRVPSDVRKRLVTPMSASVFRSLLSEPRQVRVTKAVGC